MNNKVTVVIEYDDAGYFAYAPDLSGCMTQGDTFEEVSANIREAIELYLDTLTPEERAERLSKDVFTTSFEVPVA